MRRFYTLSPTNGHGQEFAILLSLHFKCSQPALLRLLARVHHRDKAAEAELEPELAKEKERKRETWKYHILHHPEI